LLAGWPASFNALVGWLVGLGLGEKGLFVQFLFFLSGRVGESAYHNYHHHTAKVVAGRSRNFDLI